MGATIKDIARTLKISTSTVSYALNGGPRQVPAAVKEQVLRVARELNYRPNRVARSLVTRRSQTLGILPTQTTENFALSPYFQFCLNGAINEAEIAQHDVLVYSRFMPEGESFEAMIDTMSDGRADGIILIAPIVDSPIVSGLNERGVPIAVVNAEFADIPCFRCNNALGARQAVQHLVQLGHREIAHIAGWMKLQDAIQRYESFKLALAEAGLNYHPEWTLETDFTRFTGEQQAMKLLTMENRPTAIFCANDEIAVGVYHAAWELGIKIPDELSMIGFDNIATSSQMLPGLTTVSQPIEQMGRDAARALLALLCGEEADSFVYQTDLVVRGSTARKK